MAKIKPFEWKQESNWWQAETSFGSYIILSSVVDLFVVCFRNPITDRLAEFEAIEQAKRFAFDDFKKRLEETINEPVGYDLEIDEKC